MIPEVFQLLSPIFVFQAGVAGGGGLGPPVGPALCPDEGQASLLTVSDRTTGLLTVDDGMTSLFSSDDEATGCE